MYSTNSWILSGEKERLLVIALAVSVLHGCSIFGIRTAEEPQFQLLSKDDEFEIREYSNSLVAQVTVTGEFAEAQKKGFRLLAGYISGKNFQERKIDMTAPVTLETSGSKIEMTAPVTQVKEPKGWTLSFTMPSKYKDISSLPKPTNKEILISELRGGIYGVIRFTGLVNERKSLYKTQLLIDWLKKKGYSLEGSPAYAGYDPPLTIPFLRRHEILIKVRN